MTDTHNLSGCFHLCCEGSFCCNKFIKWKTRDFYNAVVEHRLKACVCLSCDRVWNFVQSITQSDFCRNLCDRVSCRLTCKSGRTAYSRVYLDDAVFKALRVKGILYVTAACDSKLCDNVKRRSTKHLIFFIPQRLGRSYDDRVSCMYAYRVNIFHVADSDAVSCAVTHYLILDFFPACNAAFYENLSHSGKTKTVFQDFTKLNLIICDSAAASSKCVSRTQYNRVSDGICK